MQHTITTEIEHLGVYFEIESDIEIETRDDSFSHEFGVEESYSSYISHISQPVIINPDYYQQNLDERLTEMSLRRGSKPWRRSRRFLNRSIRRHLAKVDPWKLYSKSVQEQAIEEAGISAAADRWDRD